MLPLVIAVHSPDGQIRRYAFADSPISVGRSPLAELQLNEPSVSRWEGTLRFDEREVTFFSLGSNPTLVNSREARPREDIAIGPDSVLTVGRLQLRFTREPVPEADLRAKGKRRPVQDDPSVNAATQFIRTPSLPLHVPQTRLMRSSIVRPPEHAAPLPSSSKPEPVIRVLNRVAVSRAEPHAGVNGNGPLAPPKQSPSVEQRADHGRRMTDLYQSYRSAATELSAAIRRSLDDSPASARAARCDELRRSFPEIPLNAELAISSVRDIKNVQENPALSAWLSGVAPGASPDASRVLPRMFALLEMLVQSLAEIEDAQNAVRRKWLGRPTRETILSADEPRLVLAQLFTREEGEWTSHMAALEESVRGMVTHELALFRATLRGARALLLELAPEKLAQELGLGRARALDQVGGRTLLRRLFGHASADAKLWELFASTFDNLLDGHQYQRVFLGREFARTYLAAMGSVEKSGSGSA